MPAISANACPPGATVELFSIPSHCPVGPPATNHLRKVYQHNPIGYTDVPICTCVIPYHMLLPYGWKMDHKYKD
ncbi:hypothetical protein PBY51_018405 [Eleginops maclovinus]|uniref:Uncharacterized protein n=1 Tax=Eleginops maclovinus TaxID=56733 RepID=A0AAN8AY26_ELEMC|nr:hypothetical protein PBY51_018405 [Eleginops maclovinus]